jgi:iron(III) transport system ATP-binding protein
MMPRRRLLHLSATLLAGCSGPREPGPDDLPVRATRLWPVPPGNGRAPGPRSVACAPDGTAYVTDEIGRVLVYEADGRFRTSWFMPETSVGRPEGVTVLPDGRIAVSDTHYHRVVIFAPDGRVSHQFGREGAGPGEFQYPVAITPTPTGGLAVAEYGGNDRVQLFSVDGAFQGSIGSFGTAPHQLQRPSGIKIRDGVLHVADAMNNRVQRYALADGAHLGALPLPDLRFPYDLDWHPAGAWCVVEYGAGRVTRHAPATGRTDRHGASGRGENQFFTPWGLAVSPRGNLLVADTGNKRIVEVVL